MKQPHFLHVDANLQKLKVNSKFCVGRGQKWVWPIWFWDFKIDLAHRIN